MLLVKNLKTPRLTIRSWRKTDKDFTLSLWGDKENGKYMGDPVRENMDEAYLKCVDEMEDNPDGYYLIAEWKENGTPVGICCIFPENGNYDIGYFYPSELQYYPKRSTYVLSEHGIHLRQDTKAIYQRNLARNSQKIFQSMSDQRSEENA